MGLTYGGGPLAPGGGGRWSFAPPEHVWYWEDWPQRVRAVFAGETIVDSLGVKVLHETGRFPVQYVPEGDVRSELLVPTEDRRIDRSKGPRHRWDVRVGDRVAEGAVTAYPQPSEGGPPVAGYLTVAFGSMDRWFEEDEAVYAHARDDFHRVDVRSSSRHVIVRHRGEVVAESRRPKLLFETGVPVRYYLPFADVRLERFELSDTVSGVPVQGRRPALAPGRRRRPGPRCRLEPAPPVARGVRGRRARLLLPGQGRAGRGRPAGRRLTGYAADVAKRCS